DRARLRSTACRSARDRARVLRAHAVLRGPRRGSCRVRGGPTAAVQGPLNRRERWVQTARWSQEFLAQPTAFIGWEPRPRAGPRHGVLRPSRREWHPGSAELRDAIAAVSWPTRCN